MMGTMQNDDGSVLLFAGEVYDAAGGWNDFVGRYATVDEAKAVTKDWGEPWSEPERIMWTDNTLLVSTSIDMRTMTVGSRYRTGNQYAEILAVEGRRWQVRLDAAEGVNYKHGWAHIVQHDKEVAYWCDGQWDDADEASG